MIAALRRHPTRVCPRRVETRRSRSALRWAVRSSPALAATALLPPPPNLLLPCNNPPVVAVVVGDWGWQVDSHAKTANHHGPSPPPLAAA